MNMTDGMRNDGMRNESGSGGAAAAMGAVQSAGNQSGDRTT